MKKLLIAIVFLLLTCEFSYSQGNLTITVVRNLNFEDVFGGQSKTVPITDQNCALFQLDVRGNNHVFRVSFTLTSTLVNGSNTIPVTYSSNHAGYRINNNNPAGSTSFNPHGNFQLNPSNRDVIYVWIGGETNPQLAAQPGTYTANIVITVEKL